MLIKEIGLQFSFFGWLFSAFRIKVMAASRNDIGNTVSLNVFIKEFEESILLSNAPYSLNSYLLFLCSSFSPPSNKPTYLSLNSVSLMFY